MPARADTRIDHRTHLSPDAAIAMRGFAQIWKGALAWAFVFGLSAASSAITYANTYPTVEDRAHVAATVGKDAGFAVLLGPIAHVDTVGGYMVYKCFVFLTTIGAIWALLITTRLLRGQEETGRWQLMLAASRTSPTRALAATLGAVGLAVLVVFLGTLAMVGATGRSPKLAFPFADTLLYSTSLVIAPLVFVAVGAVTSQLAGTRRQATGMGMAVFGAALVLRMAADAGPSTKWLLWATPFGWIERMHPYTENNPWPLVPAAAAMVLLGTTAVYLAAHRDCGAGVLSAREVGDTRNFGLRSPAKLAVRLELPTLLGWAVGVLLGGFAFGMIAKVTTQPLPKSFGSTLSKFGVHGSFVNQFLGVTFLFMATLVALIPASQVGAAADEETSGRLVHILARPVSAPRFLIGRLTLAASAVLAAGLLSASGVWLGCASQGMNVPLGALVRAGFNTVPFGLLILGLGAITLAAAPRRATMVVYAVVVWSIVGDLFGAMVPSLHVLERTSVFHFMALAPAETVRPMPLVIVLGLAFVLLAAAVLIVGRRDVQTA